MITIVVGNIGTVHEGTNRRKADKEYDDFVRLSKRSAGRASGEQVTMFVDGEPVRTYDPPEAPADEEA